MLTLETVGGENRCEQHLAEIDSKAKAKRKPIYIPIPKVELPASADERAKLWDDCVLETALGLRHLIYSDDPDTARWAIEQLVALEKTSVRHNRRLAGTERPPGTIPDFSSLPLPDLPLDPLPVSPAPKREAKSDSNWNGEQSAASTMRRQAEALEHHIGAAHAGLLAEAEKIDLDADCQGQLKKIISRQWAVWAVQHRLMSKGLLPDELDPQFFPRLNFRGLLGRFLEHGCKPKEEMLRAIFGEYAEELLEMEAAEERRNKS